MVPAERDWVRLNSGGRARACVAKRVVRRVYVPFLSRDFEAYGTSLARRRFYYCTTGLEADVKANRLFGSTYGRVFVRSRTR